MVIRVLEEPASIIFKTESTYQTKYCHAPADRLQFYVVIFTAVRIFDFTLSITVFTIAILLDVIHFNPVHAAYCFTVAGLHQDSQVIRVTGQPENSGSFLKEAHIFRFSIVQSGSESTHPPIRLLSKAVSKNDQGN